MPKCNIYFQQGVKAGMESGMGSQDMAACNIYRIQKGIKAPGLGKGGKRSTRRGAKGARSTRRMRGGADGACVAAVRRLLPDERDYQRMQDYECSAVEPGQSYREWVDGQLAKARALSVEDCAFVTELCGRIMKGKMAHMDMESCSVFGTVGLFFDNEGRIVTFNDR
jgi:hypothetical protein